MTGLQAPQWRVITHNIGDFVPSNFLRYLMIDGIFSALVLMDITYVPALEGFGPILNTADSGWCWRKAGSGNATCSV